VSSVGEPTVSGPALVVRGPHDVVIEERTSRAPAPGEVTIKPHHVGVCGTDLEIIHGSLDPAYVRYPLVLGHEWSGRVLAVGDGVDAVAPGDPVVVEGILADGTCTFCRAGKTNLCLGYDELGFTTDGAAGPAVTVAGPFVHRLAPDIPLDAGALVEPAAVVLRGLLEVKPEPGRRVLVIGDGTVALLAAHLVRMWSPSSVTVAGRRAEQKALAEAVGAEDFTVDPPPGRSYDLVVEAAGSTAAVETAVGAVAPSGQVLLLGIAGHGNAANLRVDDVVNHDITIRGSFSYTAAAWAETVRLLNAGSFRPLPLVTHRYPLDRYAEAFDTLAAGGGGPRGKILFELPADA
jgi:L-iditol 2-dehydrogenase